jgi:predicted DsbA family dithiol-disulfide isomerase
MQRLLFANQRALSRADLDRYAATIGLDMKRFANALDTRAHRATVEADAERADEADVRGTPAYFVGPYQVSGALPLRQFRRLVDRILAPPPGTSPGTRRE